MKIHAKNEDELITEMELKFPFSEYWFEDGFLVEWNKLEHAASYFSYEYMEDHYIVKHNF
jgi:hypothetical protein